MADVTLVAEPRRYGADIQQVNDNFEFGELFTFDATVSESYGVSVEWTQNPVEEGVAVADHGTDQPVTLSLEGVISATPLDPYDQEPDRVAAIVDRLEAMVRAKIPVIVSSGMRVYPQEMVIASASFARDAGTGQAVNVSLTLQEWRTVSSKTVLVPPEKLAPKVKPGASPEVDGGKQSPTDALPEDAASVEADIEKDLAILQSGDGSWANDLYDAVRGE